MAATVSDVKEIVRKLCKIVIDNEKYFCELDSVAGDGDFGMSLAKGFRKVEQQFDEIDASTTQKFLRGCSLVISEFCGGASGPIWGSAFGAAASSAKGKEVLQVGEIAQMFADAVAAIQKRGGAKQGDKTLLDALIPAADALACSAEEGKGIGDAFRIAAAKAEEGAEATRLMVASKGRAMYVGERSLNHPDAGAAAVALILKILSQG